MSGQPGRLVDVSTEICLTSYVLVVSLVISCDKTIEPINSKQFVLRKQLRGKSFHC